MGVETKHVHRRIQDTHRDVEVLERSGLLGQHLHSLVVIHRNGAAAHCSPGTVKTGVRDFKFYEPAYLPEYAV